MDCFGALIKRNSQTLTSTIRKGCVYCEKKTTLKPKVKFLVYFLRFAVCYFSILTKTEQTSHLLYIWIFSLVNKRFQNKA